MTQGQPITVYKLDENGRETWRYGGRVLRRGAHAIQLEAAFDLPAVDLRPVVLQQGDRFVETFYSDRWYNVFAVYDGETGALKGWYCNVCRPAQIEDGAVRCEDLALDVWVAASGEATLLDEEEFAALVIDDESRKEARAALKEILRLAAAERLPR